jgi:predicted neuraminidase
MELLTMIRLLALVAVLASSQARAADALLKSEFIYETAPFPSCHASTIVESKNGLVAAWFGGTDEGNKDVGIWLAHLKDGQWTAPVEVANGVQADGKRHPCWNPVLFQPKDAPLMLFYKVGPSPSTWWGMLRTSTDGGQTWSDATRLPDRILGPIKNKPIQLADGTILAGSSTEGLSPPPEWQLHMERSTDGGKTWSFITVPTTTDGPSAIQPSILQHADGSLQALGRTRSKKLFTTTSTDKGLTWSKVELTDLPNPSSGTDAVTLRDGRHLLIFNPVPKGRTPLNIATSKDGKNWNAALVLETEPGEYSYPAIIQTADGLVHATYTWKRQKVRHVVIDPAKLDGKPIVNGEWPK